MIPLDNSQCVILVPVGGSIVPECEDALRELERRGYEVRRIRGFSQVDVARNQIASDALRDGFEELFWVDSDIVFNPDDVDRLRATREPFICAIYPKKGPREFACNYLAGTEALLFGQGGGIRELLYVGFGFNLTHRSVYERVQRECGLPVCNERFREALVPFFMPMVMTDEFGPWYLGEDYAFCERVRQCGFKILVDTTIRLWHIGNYKYSWEDAGQRMERYGTYNFSTSIDWKRHQTPRLATALHNSPGPGWDKLRAEFPWPRERPPVIPNAHHGWMHDSVKHLLARELTSEKNLVLELGAWLGLSTRYILEQAPHVSVISVDHWNGSPEHVHDPKYSRLLPHLFETFQANCWAYRERLLALRKETIQGIQTVADAGLQPDLVYLDADHSYEAVLNDLQAIRAAFPKATIVGDDWDWEGVQKAAIEFATQNQFRLITHGVAWKIDDREILR